MCVINVLLACLEVVDVNVVQLSIFVPDHLRDRGVEEDVAVDPVRGCEVFPVQKHIRLGDVRTVPFGVDSGRVTVPMRSNVGGTPLQSSQSLTTCTRCRTYWVRVMLLERMVINKRSAAIKSRTYVPCTTNTFRLLVYLEHAGTGQQKATRLTR